MDDLRGVIRSPRKSFGRLQFAVVCCVLSAPLFYYMPLLWDHRILGNIQTPLFPGLNVGNNGPCIEKWTLDQEQVLVQPSLITIMFNNCYIITSTCKSISRGIYFLQICQCVLTGNLGTANKYRSTRMLYNAWVTHFIPLCLKSSSHF